VPLRAEPQERLTIDYIKYMVKRYAFFENNWNISGSFDNDFVDNSDGTVTDRTTGLMWQKDGSSSGIRRRRALSYAKKLNKDQFAGYSDWRLPTVDELASLLSKDKANGMHIDALFATKQKLCWSSDVAPDSLVATRPIPQVWVVSFKKGKIRTVSLVSQAYFDGPRSSEYNYVRAVRSIK
jgi:hypothetical protein